MSKSRSYSFTINNYTMDDFARILWLSDNSRYLVVGFEKVKTEHMQCYVYFLNACRISTLKQYVPRAHIEVSKGSPQQNYEYCTKDGEYFEFGQLPVKGHITMDKLHEVMKNPQENIQMFTQYRKVYNEIKRSTRKIDEPRLFVIPSNCRIKFYNIVHKTTCFDIETYDNEDVLFLPSYHNFDLELWINGIPPKFKRGYEIINYDPQIIVMTYSDPEEYNYIIKNYIDYIDRCLREEDFEEEIEIIEEESDMSDQGEL